MAVAGVTLNGDMLGSKSLSLISSSMPRVSAKVDFFGVTSLCCVCGVVTVAAAAAAVVVVVVACVVLTEGCNAIGAALVAVCFGDGGADVFIGLDWMESLGEFDASSRGFRRFKLSVLNAERAELVDAIDNLRSRIKFSGFLNNNLRRGEFGLSPRCSMTVLATGDI